MNVVIQNINNAKNNRVEVEAEQVNYPQHFPPMSQLKTNGKLYLYYEESFIVVAQKIPGHYIVMPAYDKIYDKR